MAQYEWPQRGSKPWDHIVKAAVDAINEEGEATKAEVENRLSEANLNATIGSEIVAASGIPTPAIAAGSTGRFDSARSAYNFEPAALLKFRTALGQAIAGTGLCRIAMLGDSTVAGASASGIVRGTSDVATYLRNALIAAGYPAMGTGLVPVSRQVTTNPDPRWGSFTGTWVDASLFRQTGSSGASATFTSDVAGTVVEIYVENGSNGPWSYQIDGGAVVPVANVTGGTTANKITVTGLANTTHTVVVAATSATRVNFIGAEVRQATGITVSNFGVGGNTSSSINSNTDIQIKTSVAEGPSLVLVNIGINDYHTSVPVADFKANLASCATYYPNASFVYAIGNPVETVVTPSRDVYRQAQYEQADVIGAPVLDLCHRWGSATTAKAIGLIDPAETVGVHPTPAGNADIARAWFAALGL